MMRVDPKCARCPRLVASRTQVVQASGPDHAEVMVVGQAPGRNEDSEGHPFVGASGQALRKLLERGGLNFDQCYVTNAVKCYPAGDRKPSKNECSNCAFWLNQEIRAVGPSVIITVGDVALQALLPGERLSQVHGTRVVINGLTIVPMYHPAAAMRRPRLMTVLLQDFDKLAHPPVPATWTVVGAPRLVLSGHVALDLETTTPQVGGKFAPTMAEPIGCALAWRTPTGVKASYGSEIMMPKGPVVYHNAKFEYQVLKRQGFVREGFEDTKLMAYVLGLPSTHLKDLGGSELGVRMTRYEEWDRHSPEYPASDAACTLLLYERLAPRLEEEGVLSVYRTVELPLVPVLADMEVAGVRVDLERLANVREGVVSELAILEQTFGKVNLRSSKQVGELLYGTGGLPVLKRTAGGAPSTTRAVLERLPGETAAAVRRHRELSKLQSGYLDALPRYVHTDGRIHGSFNQAGGYEDSGDKEAPETGRLSSSRPNLQNIPHRTELGRQLRSCFIPAPGYQFVRADISQEEPRIAAFLAGDTRMLARMDKGADIYEPIVAKMAWLTADAYTRRLLAKTLFLAKMYGAGAATLRDTCLRFGYPLSSANAVGLDKWLEIEYPSVTVLAAASRRQVDKEGFVTTWFGRKRWLPAAFVAGGRAEALRQAANTPVQGTAADVIKMVLVRVHGALGGMDARLVLTVHDEWVVEAAVGTAVSAVTQMCAEATDGLMPIRLPVDVRAMDSWM